MKYIFHRKRHFFKSFLYGYTHWEVYVARSHRPINIFIQKGLLKNSYYLYVLCLLLSYHKVDSPRQCRM